jgi:hypothetical protein
MMPRIGETFDKSAIVSEQKQAFTVAVEAAGGVNIGDIDELL